MGPSQPHLNTASQESSPGGQEAGTPKAAENQRRNKEVAASEKEKGAGNKED